MVCPLLVQKKTSTSRIAPYWPAKLFESGLKRKNGWHLPRWPRGRTRRYRLSVSHTIRNGSSGLLDGHLVRNHLAGDCALLWVLLASHLCHWGWLSPVLLAPNLFDQPGIPISARIAGPIERAKERALVDGQAPTPPLAFGYRAGHSFTSTQGLFVQPPRLDIRPSARRH